MTEFDEKNSLDPQTTGHTQDEESGALSAETDAGSASVGEAETARLNHVAPSPSAASPSSLATPSAPLGQSVQPSAPAGGHSGKASSASTIVGQPWRAPSSPSYSEGADAQVTSSSAEAPTTPLAPPNPYTSVPSAPAGYSFTRGGSAYGSSQPFQYSAPQEGQPSDGAGTQVSGQVSSSTPAGPGGQTPVASSVTQPVYPGSSSAPTATLPAGGEEHDPFAAKAMYGVGYPNGPAYAAPGGANKRKERRGPGWGGVIAATVAAALLASGGTAVVGRYFDRPTVTTSITHTSTGGTTKTVASTGNAPDWEAVSQAVSDAVVSITVATSSGTAMGSGVIYDSAGHIITNNHVVSGASQIQVTLADGRIFAAKLTGTDPATDLAVIQLQNAPSNLTVASFGDSDQVVTGEDVMAIGNPLGLSSTVTTGIVSAINRPVVTTQEESSGSDSSSQSQLPGGLGELLRPQQTTTSQTYTNAIQIDAAINPGNSGGPLFDETGKVIGITSSIAQLTQESGSIGLGFAIPGNLATKVADQLIASGKATHAYLGVSIADGAAQAGDTTRAGAEIGSVESGSPAAQAGLQKGDVITAIDGKATSQAAALTGFVRQYSAGDTVTLTVVRDGEEKQIQVTLAEREDS